MGLGTPMLPSGPCLGGGKGIPMLPNGMIGIGGNGGRRKSGPKSEVNGGGIAGGAKIDRKIRFGQKLGFLKSKTFREN